MSDPLNTSDINTDAQDWADPKTTNIARLMAFFILPSIFVLIAIFAIFWGLTHQKKPVATVSPVAAVSAPAVTDKDAQIAQLQGQLLALQSQVHPAEGAAVVPAQPYYAPDPTALAQLSARLDRVEAAQRDLVKATSAAYAARSLQLAAKNQQPFLSELAVVEPALNDPAVAATLRPYAEKGVPSEIALAVTFPSIAARANIAAKADDGKDGILDKIRHAIGGFISVRRIGNPGGQGAEAILERAEIRLNGGDLKGAVAYLDTLSPSAQKALSPWLEQARARVLVDDTTRRISETALNHLSQMTNASTAPLNNGGVL
ncbi:COG4223 family protein [Asticcacaulis sp.]|uniref:COG4223 family protein n=1 Tax=Asticcacaulis sp. TaxID=1872648 RepID=UPI002C8D38E8|nr:mitofilin family membrane protein [Asticcacaulis sp.]HTM79791.1 mitofilin family membrane protein [Asticcacaulis sp.]